VVSEVEVEVGRVEGSVRLAVMGSVGVLVVLVRVRLVALEGRSHAVCLSRQSSRSTLLFERPEGKMRTLFVSI
jgi:hypothetical protein